MLVGLESDWVIFSLDFHRKSFLAKTKNAASFFQLPGFMVNFENGEAFDGNSYESFRMFCFSTE